MNTLTLPQAITVGRLLEALVLQVVKPPNFLNEEVTQLSIQTIVLAGEKEFVLPFAGELARLEPKGNYILLEITILSQSLTAMRNSSSRTASTEEKISLLLNQSLPCPWPSFCEKVISWVEREQGRILAAVERYTQNLAERLVNGYGFAVLQDLHVLLGYDLFLLSKQLEILTWLGGRQLPSHPIPFISPKQRSFPPTLRLSPSGQLFPGEWIEKSYQEVPLTWYPLSGQQGILGYLGLAVKIQDISSVDRLYLFKTASLIFLELVKNRCVQENEHQHHRDFLFDLLYNNFDSVEVIVSRGKLWGWDFTKPHLVAVGEIPGFDPDSSGQEFLQDLASEITIILRNRYPGSICLERNNQIVLLFPLSEMLPAPQCYSAAEGFLEPVFRATADLPGDRQLVFGIGNLYDSARYIHRSFQEARSALELGQLFDLRQRLFAFQDLGVMRLLHRLDRQELEDFRSEVLGPLLKFDRESNLELEETLLAYFASNTDLNAAGERLFLHPNTLRYRLKKASEILGRDLSVLENQINLFIALKIGRLKSLWPE